MTETSYPSPNHNTRNVTDGEYENISAFYGDGVHALPSDGDVVVAGTGLQVLVKAGTKASLRGHIWDAGTTDIPLAVSANAGTATRYDVVTLRLDRSTWDVTAHVVEGTAGAGVPSLSFDTGDTGVFDVSLALLAIAPGAAAPTITQATRFAGLSVGVANSGEIPYGNRTGEMHFRPDSGALELFNGNKWDTVHYNTGWLTLGQGYSTWADQAENKGIRHGDVVHLRIAKIRKGSTFSAQDRPTKIATLPAVLTPKTVHYFSVVMSGKAGVGVLVVDTSGDITLAETDKDITPGRVLELTCSFPIE